MSNISKEKLYGDLFHKVIAQKSPMSHGHRLGVERDRVNHTYNDGINRIQDQMDRDYQRSLHQINKESY